MANIKISELNSLTDKAYDDLIPIVDSSANETKKISIDKLVDNNVELIAVSNDAPSECSTGDKYYNKTTNKIYTATGTNTWGTTGEDAIEGILYIVFEEQTTYAYDGETLVSVGGGAGTYVGDTPPEEPKEDDLWVDTDDDEYLAQVDDTVSTTSTNAVQNQAITKAFGGVLLWTNESPTSSFSSQNILLSSSDYDFYEIFYKIESSSAVIKSEKSIKGYGCWLEQSRAESSGGSTCRMRSISYSNATTLAVDTCWSSTGTSNRTQLDSALIPLYVVGYKTGITFS